MSARTAGSACSRCGTQHTGSGRYCKNCHNTYMREWRKTHPLSPEERLKDICRSYTNVLIKRGVLVRTPCWCGETKVEAHHPDYARPRLVIFRCREHHMLLHQELDVPRGTSNIANVPRGTNK